VDEVNPRKQFDCLSTKQQQRRIKGIELKENILFDKSEKAREINYEKICEKTKKFLKNC